jgi:hypothetical protein
MNPPVCGLVDPPAKEFSNPELVLLVIPNPVNPVEEDRDVLKLPEFEGVVCDPKTLDENGFGF